MRRVAAEVLGSNAFSKADAIKAILPFCRGDSPATDYPPTRARVLALARAPGMYKQLCGNTMLAAGGKDRIAL